MIMIKMSEVQEEQLEEKLFMLAQGSYSIRMIRRIHVMPNWQPYASVSSVEPWKDNNLVRGSVGPQMREI